MMRSGRSSSVMVTAARGTAAAGALAAAVVAALVSLGRPALAEQAGPDPDRLRAAIDGLRARYLKKLDAGQEDPDLKNLLRELNAARNAGDWKTVADLLVKGGVDLASGEAGAAAGGGEAGADDDESLWPVRGAGGTQKADEKSTVEETEYESTRGLKIKALVYRPKAATGRMPVIVLAHGGLRGVRLRYRRLAEEFAGVGYLVLAPHFRGQGRSQGEVEYARGEVFDLLAAIDAAKELEGADANRIGLVGGAHGGAVVLIALSRAEGVACAAVISPVTELDQLARNREFARELKLAHVPFGLSDTNALRERSALYYASGVQAPVLVLHGSRGRLVPFDYAERYAGVLKARGKEVTLVKYALSGDELVSKIPMYRIDIQNFLAQYLKPSGWKIQKGGKGQKAGAAGKGGQGGKGQQGGGGGRKRKF